MTKGPKGEKRPVNVISNAVKVVPNATGEEREEYTIDGKNRAAFELGKKGGHARAKKLSAERRHKIAKKAAAARWGKRDGSD